MCKFKTQNSMQNDIEYCSCCGAKLTGRYERLSKGLVLNLLKIRAKVLHESEKANKLVNKVHLSNDLNLSKNQYNNFQKLRYHGLIAHYKDPITKEYESGYWIVTKRGNQFCKNELFVPKKLLIFRNRIQERSEEKINFRDVLTEENTPHWYQKEDYKMDFLDTNDFDEDEDENDNQLDLFD